MSILWEADATSAKSLRVVLGKDTFVVDSGPAATRRFSADRRESLLVVGPGIDLTSALAICQTLRLERPEVGVVLMRRRLDVTVLGQALRAGVREVVSADDLGSLSEACQRSLELSERLGDGTGSAAQDGRVVTVFAAKGGVGKTTVSTNLAAELASGGSRVLLVDLDLAFGDVGIALGLMPERSMSDLVAMAGHLDAQGLASVVTTHESGLDALCAPSLPADADRIPGSIITEVLRLAKRTYEYVVVDTPPAFTEHVLAAFDASDVSILLATLDIPAIKNLRLTLDTLDLLGHPRDSWVVVLNRSDTKVGLTAADVANSLHRPIAMQIPNSLAVSAAINRGVPIVLDDPRHPVSSAVKTLVRNHVRIPANELARDLAADPAAGVEPVPVADDRADLRHTGPVRRFFRRSEA
jgi:pilus assembly protein CpaE